MNIHLRNSLPTQPGQIFPTAVPLRGRAGHRPAREVLLFSAGREDAAALREGAAAVLAQGATRSRSCLVDPGLGNLEGEGCSKKQVDGYIKVAFVARQMLQDPKFHFCSSCPDLQD